MFCTLVEKNSAKLSGRSLLGISIEFSVRLRGNCVMLRSFAFLTAVHKDFELPGKILLLTLLVLLFWTNRLISLLISLNFMCSLKFVADFFRLKNHFFLFIKASGKMTEIRSPQKRSNALMLHR